MPSHESAKFLLVDDREDTLVALEALLRRDGLELFKARSGPEALELLLGHDFTLALLDVQMPGMDGFELAELMRGTERTRRIPIIFLTAVATDERRRFKGYEAGAVDYLFKPVDPQMLLTKAAIFFDLERQRRALARQRDELQAAAEKLTEALARIQAHADNSPLAIVEFDPEFRVIGWSNGAVRMFGWSTAEAVGRKPADLRWIQEDDAFAPLVANILDGNRGQLRTVHLCRNYRKDGTALECEWYSSALVDPKGRPVSVNAQIQDVTERRRAEETQGLLIGELNHRVKNTLATVQAIATQTLRHSGDPSEFADNFSGRIQALARAHSLLSDTTWAGTDLAKLVQEQLRFGSSDEARVLANGPAVHLEPQLALHLALILHELGTNARKYGALSTTQGQVALSWSVDDGVLHLTWTECGGPAVRAPSRRGFGSNLIEQSAKAEDGIARASYRADGIEWDITLSLSPSSSNNVPQSGPQLLAGRPGLQPLRHADGPHQKLKGRRFLVVEDEPLVAMVLVDMLADVGVEVTGPASTVEQALQMIEEAGKLDAALLDGNLRGHSSEEVAAALTRRNVPFVFVSGYGAGDLPRAFGAAATLVKPFTHDRLLEAAAGLLLRQGDVIRLRV